MIALLAAADPTEEVADATDSLVDSIAEAVPRVALALGIVLVGWLASRGLRWLLRRWFERSNPPSFSNVMSKLGGWIFLGVVVLIAVTVTFPSVKPVDLLAGLGFFSVAVGFAFQDILENTLSGVLLLFRQPFTSGDQIEVNGQIGTVQEITIRETRLKSFGGELLVIPNRDVYKSVIEVATHFEQRRQEFVVGIAYESDAQHARDVIADELGGIDGIDADPAPQVLVEELGASTINLTALFWADPRRLDGRVVRAEAMQAVKQRLDREGVEMPCDIVALQADEELPGRRAGRR